MSADPILDAEDITSGYGNNEIVHGVDLHVADGESVCIIGPNGAGKSTVLKTLTGYIPCWSGTIRFNGEDVTDAETEDLIERGISIVPQGASTFPEMTVSEHLDMGAWLLDDDAKQESLEFVYDLFPRIEERLGQKIKTMSGGEQQMVSIARALMIDPDLLVLDEPSLGLAPNLVDEVFDLINRVQAADVSILMVEQNAAKALDNTDRGYVIEMGNVEYVDVSDKLADDPEVKQLYLGG
ncbi:ABC transporter ATP-binding protein [Haloplanus rallus]|uniref:ABC transporter ATP-binding protein n=1 Tax=Haloplanus rallus TaxID=1816183 RepID=A0A6B9FD37_9EURY|nr:MULTISPECIES: ABC transporter ATP-binding protein [Haloplanus]QGX94240.1 ABC transporter ATP-binding protein [Haloplanus rallus]